MERTARRLGHRQAPLAPTLIGACHPQVCIEKAWRQDKINKAADGERELRQPGAGVYEAGDSCAPDPGLTATSPPNPQLEGTTGCPANQALTPSACACPPPRCAAEKGAFIAESFGNPIFL